MPDGVAFEGRQGRRSRFTARARQMNRTLLFDSPFLLGFDHTRALIERAAKAAGEGYPPYNVEELGEGQVRITLAVAGFTPTQLEVTLEDNQLNVIGRREGADADRA